jgi:hypothetical protein
LNPESQELLLQYYILGKTQNSLTLVTNVTQTTCSLRLRMAVRLLLAYLMGEFSRERPRKWADLTDFSVPCQYLRMKQTGIIYMATRQPSSLTDDLTWAGFRVWEALAESEVNHLCETEDIDAIVIAHDVPWRKRIAGDSGRVCVLLEPTTTAKELVWELVQLFPSRETVQ